MQIAIDNDLIIIEAENLHDEPDNEIRIQIEDNPTEEQTVLENIHVQNSLSIEDSRIEENNETLSGNIETSLVEEQQLIVQNKENSTLNFVNKGFNVNENFRLSFREALFWPDKATDKKKRKENLRIKSLLLFLHCNGST
ncbi:GSCOCG00012975001-RA-CDS [Cotesia congregata]|nr:GSCOCG00012975001-RA-CDS [Cotesia congregata]